MTVILVEKSELDGIAKYVATRIFELVFHATQSHQLISNRIYIRHGQSHHLITLRNNFERTSTHRNRIVAMAFGGLGFPDLSGASLAFEFLGVGISDTNETYCRGCSGWNCPSQLPRAVPFCPPLETRLVRAAKTE